MKRCSCGSVRFSARQQCYRDVVVDSDNNFLDDDGVTDSSSPYGPYTCYNCAKEYDSLDLLPDDPNSK